MKGLSNITKNKEYNDSVLKTNCSLLINFYRILKQVLKVIAVNVNM